MPTQSTKPASPASQGTNTAPSVYYRSSPETSPSCSERKDASPESGYSSSTSRDKGSPGSISDPRSSPGSVSDPRSSPGSVSDPRSSPEQDSQTTKKLRRATYKPEQITTLESEFQLNPYPDAERLEELSREIRIPESKLRVSSISKHFLILHFSKPVFCEALLNV